MGHVGTENTVCHSDLSLEDIVFERLTTHLYAFAEERSKRRLLLKC